MGERDFESLEKALLPVTGRAGDEARAMVQNLRSYVAPLRIAAERIAGITRQLKTFGRPPTERVEPVDLRSVVCSALQLVGKDLEARARVTLHLEESITNADESRLVQVILNLLLNAMHAVESSKRDDAEVLIRTCTVADRATLEVEDSGVGVPAGSRERIFDPFFSTKDVGEGTGLGLFVCRNIARSFGGDITLEDRAHGGTRFRLSLPARREGPVQLAPKVEKSPNNGTPRRGRILLVDDEPLLEQALADTLRHAGHEVTSVRSGAKALEILLSPEPFDLIYCDLMMRGMTGMDLAGVLHERAPDRLRHVVFMSGGAFTQEASDFLETHRDQSVDKPFDIVSETRLRLQALK
jgi:CheY-like chemotaxis protein/two-component sensor histidine kinase